MTDSEVIIGHPPTLWLWRIWSLGWAIRPIYDSAAWFESSSKTWLETMHLLHDDRWVLNISDRDEMRVRSGKARRRVGYADSQVLWFDDL